MIRKQEIIMQFLNINAILFVILISILTTSLTYESNKKVKIKREEVVRKLSYCNQNIDIGQLENKNIKNSKLFDKFVMGNEDVKICNIAEYAEYNVTAGTVKTKKVNGYQENIEVKKLNKETEKYLSGKVEGINPKVEKMTTTAYCACTKCCDKSDGITASGDEALEWYTVAAGNSYKFGTVMYIPALSDKPNGGWFIVQDRGGAISDNRLDIYFNDHEVANMFSINEFDVYIYEF